jgi:hypothetical protein
MRINQPRFDRETQYVFGRYAPSVDHEASAEANREESRWNAAELLVAPAIFRGLVDSVSDEMTRGDDGQATYKYKQTIRFIVGPMVENTVGFFFNADDEHPERPAALKALLAMVGALSVICEIALTIVIFLAEVSVRTAMRAVSALPMFFKNRRDMKYHQEVQAKMEAQASATRTAKLDSRGQGCFGRNDASVQNALAVPKTMSGATLSGQ